MPFDRAALTSALSESPVQGTERLFALGWAHWLEGRPERAEPALAEAVRLARQENAVEPLAEAAYWCARVRVLLERPDAVAEFEAVLRTLGGSPRATAWFVDLLLRSGKTDRAEQVWKSVRGNKRVTACEEGPLLEARYLLRRGEFPHAERALNEAVPVSGVVFVERLLLQAWVTASRKQYEQATALCEQARDGPYPVAALDAWRALLDQRRGGPLATEATARPPTALQELLRGHHALKEGRTEQAVEAYRVARASPAAQPFARYALAGLGEGDHASLLAAQPGVFLAVRCRFWSVLERFRRRQATPAEYLDAYQQAAAAGYQGVAADHFRRLAQALNERELDVSAVCTLMTEAAAVGPVERHNLCFAAVELAARRLPPDVARDLFREWSLPERSDAEALQSAVARQWLRAHLITPGGVGALSDLEKRLSGEPLLALVRPELPPVEGEAHPALPLLREAKRLQADEAAADDAWRESMRTLRSEARWKSLAQTLLLHEAARRADVVAVATLLEEVDVWRGLRSPPTFVMRTIAALATAHPGHPALRRGLSRWLQLWDKSALGAEGATLAVQVGLASADGSSAGPPLGLSPAPWYLYQAARALTREDATEALASVRRALSLDPDLTTVPDAEAVRTALPELERRARAQALATRVRVEGSPGSLPPGLLDGAVRELESFPPGAEVLRAIERGEPTAHAALATLSEHADLPPRLAHHLALFEHHAALAHEDAERTDAAAPCFRRAWRCWLRFLTSADTQRKEILLDYLLAVHRRRVNDLLARSAIDAARRHWNLVQELPTLVASLDGDLVRDLSDRVARFREELATDYLLATREAMRFGEVPEGWHADYEKGLAALRRFLSLDRDNPRLLTALVEVCDEWFLDLYNATGRAGLAAQVERFTPFALQLARLVEGRPGHLAARAALSDFYKFRGFLTSDRTRKEALYREALAFNPANQNVRDLLAELERE
jgi:tetratricopeptide (TPR) repeat protein